MPDFEHIHFDSVTEWLASMPLRGYQGKSSSSVSWFGESHKDSVTHAKFGQPDLVVRAEKLLDSMPVPETEDRIYQSSPMGAYAVIPEYLAGFPECMRSKQYVPSEGKPIKVFCNIFLSQGVSLEQGLKRGTAVCALLMRLQQTHPIELVICCCHSLFGSYGKDSSVVETLITVNVGILPIDLSVLAFLLASPSAYRNLMLTTNCMYDGKYRTSWPSTEGATKSALGCSESDLYIHSLVQGDKLTNDPIDWITTQVARFNHPDEMKEEVWY